MKMKGIKKVFSITLIVLVVVFSMSIKSESYVDMFNGHVWIDLVNTTELVAVSNLTLGSYTKGCLDTFKNLTGERIYPHIDEIRDQVTYWYMSPLNRNIPSNLLIVMANGYFLEKFDEDEINQGLKGLRETYK